jgi:hypothetical protein
LRKERNAFKRRRREEFDSLEAEPRSESGFQLGVVTNVEVGSGVVSSVQAAQWNDRHLRHRCPGFGLNTENFLRHPIGVVSYAIIMQGQVTLFESSDGLMRVHESLPSGNVSRDLGRVR